MREPKLIAVCGKKGVGKSFTTMIYLRHYVRVSPRRKVLIFDVNNEYSDKQKFPDIRLLALSKLREWQYSNVSEIRRIGPFYDDGTPMTLDDMAQVLQWIVRNYVNGLLLVEDINKYVSDSMPGDLIGAICTNRHKGLDIILHYQSLGRLTPKVWQNINELRMHQQTDSLDRHRNKFDDKFKYLKIAEILLDRQYKSGNKQYYLWVNFDDEKIKCNLPKSEIDIAINDYVSMYYGEAVSPFVTKRDLSGRLLFSKEKAFVAAREQLYIDHF